MSNSAPFPKRIMVVDDHPIVRHGLRQLLELEPDLAVSAEAASVDEALRRLADERPDLLMVDVELAGVSGIDLVHRVRDRYPEVPVLVVSMHDELLYAERAFRAGARGYLTKYEAPDRIVDAVRRLLDGKVYVSDRMQSLLTERLRGGCGVEAASIVDGLTERELEVFRLIGLGFGTAEIAQQLARSVKTIEAHRAHLKEKLGLRRGSELVRVAAQWVARDQAP